MHMKRLRVGGSREEISQQWNPKRFSASESCSWNWSFFFFSYSIRWYVITRRSNHWAIKLHRNQKRCRMKFKWNRLLIMVIDLLLARKSFDVKKKQKKAIKCSGHVPFYLNIYWPFNGKYTWGAARAPLTSLNKMSLNEIVKRERRGMKLILCHFSLFNQLDDDKGGGRVSSVFRISESSCG